MTAKHSIQDLFDQFLDFLSETEAPEYTTITQDTALGGMQYHYLARTRKNWTIRSTPAASANLFAKDPLVRWVNGNDVYDLTLDGEPWTPTAIADALGLKISLAKGGYRASKRWSRIMRPYHMGMFLPSDQVNIRYLDQDPIRDKVWDGAGLISRKMLNKMSQHLETLPLSPRLRRKLQRELADAKRVEFTVQGRAGQDKGHAIVSETLTEDFLLIQDTKTEVTSTDGNTFIGINRAHAHTHMRLDVQSLINLRGSADDPFWTNDQLLTWLSDTSTVFQQALERGDVTEAMKILDGTVTLEDIQAWHLREYFASKGETLWFAGIIKTLMNQHLKAIRASNLENLRLPMIGGRFYIMPSGVGQAAGLQINVRRGYVLLDEQSATAWVHDKDWLHLPKSPNKSGIAKLLGGADNDDALWCHPFTDHDGQKQILCWRSPNQFGEYLLLKPETTSADLTWFDGETTISYPPNDSRKLPPRIDTATPDYLGLVIQDSAFDDVPYSIDAMTSTVQRIEDNEGALGMYCNLLMLSQALYGKQPKQPAARLEEIIDASVKTGDDLSQIKEYCYDKSSVIVETGCAIPKALWKRLSIRHGENTPRPKLTATSNHWLDQLINGIKAHITAFGIKRDHLMQNAQPPLAIFQYASEHNLLDMGGQFNSLYATALQQKSQIDPRDGYDLARQKCEAFLTHQKGKHIPEDILIGALANGYLNHASDAAVWQPGAPGQDDQRNPGIANLTLQALRSVGLIDHLQMSAQHKLKCYPSIQPTYHRTAQIELNGVWFNYLRAKGGTYARLSDVDKTTADNAKATIRQLAAEKLTGYTLTIRRDPNNRLTVYGPQGHLFAFIDKKHEALVQGNMLTILAARETEGDLKIACEFS